MEKYSYKIENKDFIILENMEGVKGTRKKKVIVDGFVQKDTVKVFKPYKIGFLKYELYNCSESYSEKVCFEIAKILDIPCAEIELAKDRNNNIGIINYMFTEYADAHSDAKELFTNGQEPKNYWCISNIKKNLDSINSHFFSLFVNVMVFDALVGETDRHEENWGILKQNGKYMFSPMYDNGCNLLREFKDEKYLNKYVSGIKDFNIYINRSETLIYKENSNKKYKHFALIEYLYKLYPQYTRTSIEKLKQLTDEKVCNILNKMPDDLITSLHKEYIYKYIITRRDILLNIIKDVR